MTLGEYTDNAIMQDLAKLDYLYGLKRELRYNQQRTESIQTESVAEHVYGMHILAQYFLPLEDPNQTWDRAKIFQLITLHDIDEVETGDVLGYKKTAEQMKAERQAQQIVIDSAPEHMRPIMSALLDEYDAQISLEAKFVKAIDKLEPVVHLYNENVHAVLKEIQATAGASLTLKEPHVALFPFIKLFCDTAHKHLVDSGYFWEE